MGIFSSKLSAKMMGPICRQLATSYDAGIPIVRGLQMIAEHEKSPLVKRLFSSVANDIGKGETLSSALKKNNSVLPDLFIAVVSAGEKGGRLDELLRDMADYYENMHAMLRSAAVAMIYPLLQLICAWFLGTFALGILPNLNPMSTQSFSLNVYFHAYLLFQAKAMGLFAIAALVLVILTRMGMLHMPWAVLKNTLWPLNIIMRKLAMARFFRGMSLLVGAGLDIRHCIMQSAALTMNSVIEKDLLQAVPVIAQGGTFVEAFARCRYINRVGKEMIAVGEQSGNLDKMMHKVAEYQFNEARDGIQAAARIGFVLIILVVGIIVGAIVITFYSRLFGNMLNGI